MTNSVGEFNKWLDSLPSNTFSESMLCRFEAWRVVTDKELRLEMPRLNCPDMRNAIRIAEVIMPGVEIVATFSGGKADTEYRKEDGEWKAFLPRKPIIPIPTGGMN